ncbi:HAD hydrolase-like protein [Stieleria sp. ICT_E10.1]|uniref:HAD family hydrolase n=1 Tax=Stieleria sedimenti TaxID=2976331 RepID=UPI00217F91D3|nr:HAD hydrolase-like protein [Stieleria sedimenti]MCS7469066.1 HAD hydrolase-like protein [Stieleria sedimenti]
MTIPIWEGHWNQPQNRAGPKLAPPQVVVHRAGFAAKVLLRGPISANVLAMRTLFFDIDGTLLVTQRSGSGALVRAMVSEFGVADLAIEHISFGGRTDRDLVYEFLVAGEIEPTPANQGRLRRRYAVTLRETLPTVRGEVLPGVAELLPALSATPHVSLAVMTGNFPETARMKLETFRLIDFFPWVIGGDLDTVRCDMARRAADQLARRRGETARDDMIVIGDTPNDVRCAHTIGAKCLAVCTGTASREELELAGADRIVDDLTDRVAWEFLVR